MTKDFDLNKVKKFSKGLRITMNVFFWASIAFITLTVIFAVAIKFLPKEYLSAKYLINNHISFDFNGGLKYFPAQGYLPENTDFTRVIVSMIGTAFTYCLALSVIFKEIRDILKTVEMGIPFEKENAKRLSRIGSVLIGGSILFNAMNGLVTVNIIKSLGIKNFDFVLSPDLFILFTGLLVLILAGVFKYGSYLQNEYDTTL